MTHLRKLMFNNWIAVVSCMLSGGITILLLSQSFNLSNQLKSIKFFFQDESVAERIHVATTFDLDTRMVYLTRMFHNKPIVILDIFFVSLYRSFDIPYLFSLSTKIHSPYDFSQTYSPLFPVELPFFLTASIFLIRNWKNYQDRYIFLIILLILSLVISGVLIPTLSPLALAPLAIIIRTITCIGVYEIGKKYLWPKKVF